MDKEPRQAARRQMVMLMQAGQGWEEAARLSGVQVGRSTAYRLLQAFRVRGEAAFQDGRHGHLTKLRAPVRKVLEETCREAPHIPSRLVQGTLNARFGVQISIGHLNRVRSNLGLGSRLTDQKKNACWSHCLASCLS
jgi:transposase